MSIATKWTQFKTWLKKHAPQWLQDGIDAAVQFLVPFLLKIGLSSMVSESRKTRAKLKS